MGRNVLACDGKTFIAAEVISRACRLGPTNNSVDVR